MIAYYAEREILVTVDGSQPPDDVAAALVDQIEHHKKFLDQD